jgi:hypothetical protein
MFSAASPESAAAAATACPSPPSSSSASSAAVRSLTDRSGYCACFAVASTFADASAEFSVARMAAHAVPPAP